MEKKRKHDSEKPRVTYYAAGRTFDRLLKESSLLETKNAIRMKLELPSDSVIRLQQLRDGNAIDLDDDDDFEAFYTLAHEKKSMDVQVTVVSQHNVPHLVAKKKRGRSKTPMSRPPSPPIEVSLLPGEDDDGPPASKKRRVTFESSLPRPDLDDVGDWLRSKLRTSDSTHITDVDDSHAASDLPPQEGRDQTVTPRRGRKRSGSNVGLPPESSAIVSELSGEAGTSQKDKERSKSKTRRSTSRTPAKRQKSPFSIDGTSVVASNNDVEYVGSDSDRERDVNRIAKPSTGDKGFAEGLSASTLVTPVTVTTLGKSKRSRKLLVEDPTAPEPSDSCTNSVANQAKAVNNLVAKEAAPASKPRASGRKRAHKDKSEGNATQKEFPHIQETPPKERPLTERDEELAKTIFSRVLSKYSNLAIDKTILEKVANSVEEPAPAGTISETNKAVSDSSTTQTRSNQTASRHLPGSGDLLHSSSVNPKGVKTTKSTKLDKLPCPVCLNTPFHLRYRCPIVVAGPDAIKKRLEELKSKDTEKELIGELERMIKSRDNASRKPRISNESADPMSLVTGLPKQQTLSGVSDKVPNQLPPKASTSGGDVGNAKRSRDEVSIGEDSDEQSEITIVQPSTASMDQPVSRNSPSCANVNLDDVVRGPVVHRRSLDSILDEFVDEEDVDDDMEPDAELDDEEEEGYDAKLRRLSKRFEKDSLSSDDGESEEGDSVIDITEMIGARSPSSSHQGRAEPLSFLVMANGDGASDVEQPSTDFTKELAVVLNEAAGASEDETRVALSTEKESPSDATRLPTSGQPDNNSLDPLQGSRVARLASYHEAIEKPLTNIAETSNVVDTAATMPVENVNPPPAGRRNASMEDDDPIEPAEDFPAVDRTDKPRNQKTMVQRMQTRSSGKKNLAAATEVVEIKTPRSKGKGGLRVTKGASQNDAKTPVARQKSIAADPPPEHTPVVIDSSIPDVNESAPRSRVKGKANRTTTEKSDVKGKMLMSKAEILAQAVADQGPKRTARKSAKSIVLISPPRPTSLPQTLSLDKWATLTSGRDDSSVVDQLHSSSPTEPENSITPVARSTTIEATNALNDGHAVDTASADLLFLPSESQIPFPYSQWKDDATQTRDKDKEAHATASSESDSEVVVIDKLVRRRRSSVSYRSLTDIARRKALFPVPVSSPAAQTSQRSIGNRLGNMYQEHLQREEEASGSESDSSEDDNASHIPKARLAGVTVRAQKTR